MAARLPVPIEIRPDVGAALATGQGRATGLCTSNGSPVFFREHVRIEVGDPLPALARDPQIPECVANIGADGLPEESRIRCAQIIGSLIAELIARAGLPKFGKQGRRLAQIVNVGQLADQIRGTK